jgi:hypothetical protein
MTFSLVMIARGQSNTQLTGFVFDQSGAAIAGATLAFRRIKQRSNAAFHIDR